MRIAMSLAIAGALLACSPPPPGREVLIGMVEYGFIPARIEVVAGERVRFVVRNYGRLEHDLSVDDRGRALGLEHVHLGPGGAANKDWTAPAGAATVRVVCSLPGHEQYGMTATLVVTPAGAAPSP